MNAYNAARTKLPDGSRCGLSRAGDSVVITIVTWNLPVDSSEITQTAVRIVGACAASEAAQGSCRKGMHDAVTIEAVGPFFGGCLNARRAGGSCSEGMGDAALSWAARQTPAALDYLNNRASSGGSSSETTSSGGGDDDSVLLAQASQAGRLGMGNQAGNAGNIYDNGQPVDGGCGYCRSPSVDIPRMPEISFDIRSLIPLPIRLGWEWIMSVAGVTYPNNPDNSDFDRINGGKGAKTNPEDGSVWERDQGNHGRRDGDPSSWKRWKDRKSWERKDEPNTIWPDGRIRK